MALLFGKKIDGGKASKQQSYNSLGTVVGGEEGGGATRCTLCLSKRIAI